MTTTKPYTNFIMHCHLNEGKIDITHPIQLVEANIGDSLLSSVFSNEELSSTDFEQVGVQLENYTQPETFIKMALHFDQSMVEGIIVNVIASGLASKKTGVMP